MAQQTTNPVGDGQPQPQTFYLTIMQLRQTMKLPEDLFMLITGNPRPGIPHINAHGIVQPARTEQDAPGIRIPNCIGQQVLQYPSQQYFIAVHHRTA